VAEQRRIPDNPLAFIKRCIERRKIFWTYHVNMRFGQRPISRQMILSAVDSYDIIEEYPRDKYLPSYLIRAEHRNSVFHIHVATDVLAENIRIVTTYVPDPLKWDADFRLRR
jgi:hypothetical protein